MQSCLRRRRFFVKMGGWILSALLVFSISACGTSYRDHKITLVAAEKLEPAVETLPLNVGVYYGPEFKSFAASDTQKSGSSVDRFHFRLGGTSESYLNQVFSALFETTHLLERPPEVSGELLSKTGGALDGIIEPRIKSASKTSIRFEFFLYDANERLLGSWDRLRIFRESG